jgi:hypothetical protein
MIYTSGEKRYFIRKGELENGSQIEVEKWITDVNTAPFTGRRRLDERGDIRKEAAAPRTHLHVREVPRMLRLELPGDGVVAHRAPEVGPGLVQTRHADRAPSERQLVALPLPYLGGEGKTGRELIKRPPDKNPTLCSGAPFIIRGGLIRENNSARLHRKGVFVEG